MSPGEEPAGATEDPPTLGPLFIVGVAGYPLLAMSLATRMAFPLGDAFFLAALLELLPVLAIAQVPLLQHARVERVPAYFASATAVATLGVLACLLGARRTGLEGMGLRPPDPVILAIWTPGLCLVTLATVALLHWIRKRLGLSVSAVLGELIPRTTREKRVFTLLAVAAGFGEELAFRGYALPALSPYLWGPWGSAVFGSLTFGLLHAYQGPFGMARAALLGLILAASLILTASLWPAILAHILLDLAAGLLFGDRLVD